MTHKHQEHNRVEYLDGWRGGAILLVLLGHFLPISFSIGRFGVDVFFVLSGFLMANILFVKKVPLSIFYKRRFSRIFPVFFVYVSLIYLISYFIINNPESGNFLYTISFTRSYFPADNDLWSTGLPINHLWSLNIEEHCYLFLSIFALVKFYNQKQILGLVLIAIGCLGVYLEYWYFLQKETIGFNVYIRTEASSAPLILSAGYFLLKDKFEAHIQSWMPLLATIVAILCYTEYSPHWTARWTLTPFLLAFSINHIDKAALWLKELLSHKWLTCLGLWSYSIYLWQQPFYDYLHSYIYNDGINILIRMSVGCIFIMLTILIGYLSFNYIEKPTRNYINNYTLKRKNIDT